MPECISAELKQILLHILAPCKCPEMEAFIKNLPDCKGRKGATGRGRSAYQEHISKCMQEHKAEYAGKPFGAAGPIMKKCAQEWRDKKKNA